MYVYSLLLLKKCQVLTIIFKSTYSNTKLVTYVIISLDKPLELHS